MHPPRVISASATQLVICVILSLAAGAVLGSTSTIWMVDRLRQRLLHNPEQMAVHITEKMQCELDLDAAQVEKVRPILNRHCAEMSEAGREMHVQMRNSFKNLEKQMRPVLTDRQWKIWLPHIRSRVEWLFPVEAGQEETPGVAVSWIDSPSR